MSLDVYLYLEVDTGNGIKQMEVYDSNITHNLNEMAEACSEEFYKALWRPEELFETPRARDILPILEEGLKKLLASPSMYQEHNPYNGWGNYYGLVRFTREYVQACKEYPAAVVRASR